MIMWKEAAVMVILYISGSIDQDDSIIPQLFYDLNSFSIRPD